MEATPNPSLNPGGFIGAACGAVAGGIIGFIINPDVTKGMHVGIGTIGGLIVCAMIGNQLWGWAASKVKK